MRRPGFSHTIIMKCLSLSGSVVCKLELSQSLEALCDAVCHALTLTLTDDGAGEVAEAGLHALGSCVNFKLGFKVLNSEQLQLVFVGELIG